MVERRERLLVAIDVAGDNGLARVTRLVTDDEWGTMEKVERQLTSARDSVE